ncbi:MAG: efflux RND transporter periplasmic adaptor subunit [Isosphaeraceae bacterium]
MPRDHAMGLALGIVLGIHASLASAQTPPTSAKLDTQPMELIPAERYRLPSPLEPVRRITLVAPADGVVRSQDARAGADVRVGQEIAKLDTAEAFAMVRIAQAEAKERQVAVDLARRNPDKSATTLAEARLEAAKARVELAQAQLERCSLRAPFPGRVLRSHVSDGQFVTKGTVIAELADVSSLKALIPLARGSATLGGNVTVMVEGQPVSGKVQAFLPLPEEYAPLRELATPITSAWVVLPTSATLEPGQRAFSPVLPNGPVANVPAQAVQAEEGRTGSGMVQVLRNEYVTNVPVSVLGSPGLDRLQISGGLRPTDALIVSTSVPLLPGTFVRFNESRSDSLLEGTTPNPGLSGEPALVGEPEPNPSPRPAPIGAPGSALPRRPGTPPPSPPRGTPPAARPGANTVPF